MVQISSGDFRNGAFGTLGVEWRKALFNQVEFTYGADLVLGRSAARWVRSEARSSDYSVKQMVNGQPLYDARFGSSSEMIRNEWTANQFGARLTGGLKMDLHKFGFYISNAVMRINTASNKQMPLTNTPVCKGLSKKPNSCVKGYHS